VENTKTNFVPPWEAVLVIIVTFFVFIFLSAASLLTIGDKPTLVIGELLILAVPFGYLLLKRIDIKSFVKIDLNPKFIALGLACGGLLLLLNIVVSGALTTVFGTSQAVEQSNSLITGLSTSPSGLTAVVASLALAGVCEEFAFRGFLQNSIFKAIFCNPQKAKYAFPIAVTISAVVFGLFHFDPQGVYTISAFISGLALGYIYHRWNYTTSAIAHASMNLIVLVLLLRGF
jgi:membrane protease YdiL (CAAX protease family)